MKKRRPKQSKSTGASSALPLVYLAGPITGCNALQRTEWRREVKARYSTKFKFVDPTESLITDDGEASRFALARKDAEAIRQADAVLANMWKESIGTAIGVVEARRAGKLVVLVDRNFIQSTFLAYFVDAVARSVDDGLRQIDLLLSTQRKLEVVVKRGGATSEPFDREKLARSVRAACAAARKNDVLGAAEILPRVMTSLIRNPMVTAGRVPSAAIRDAVHATLDDLTEDEVRGEEFSGVRQAWDTFVVAKQRTHEKGRLELLKDAYEGQDWRRRVSAEIELTGHCPMNALRLCTQFEDAWLAVGRTLGVVSKDLNPYVRDLGDGVFHSIGIKAEALKRSGRLPRSFPRITLLLTEARRSRNAVIHQGAFNRRDALIVLEGWEALRVFADAVA